MLADEWEEIIKNSTQIKLSITRKVLKPTEKLEQADTQTQDNGPREEDNWEEKWDEILRQEEANKQDVEWDYKDDPWEEDDPDNQMGPARKIKNKNNNKNKNENNKEKGNDETNKQKTNKPKPQKHGVIFEEITTQPENTSNNPGSNTDKPPEATPEEQTIKDMQDMFPHYNWYHNLEVPTYRMQYLAGPKQIGLTKQANKQDNKNTTIPAGSHHYQPMKWYLSRLKWEAPGTHHRGTTNAELALDYEAATGVPLYDTHSTHGKTLQERAITFASTAKTVARLCGRNISPGDSSNRVAALVSLKLPHLRGHDYRARLLRPVEVGMALASHQAKKLAPESTVTALAFEPKWHIQPGEAGLATPPGKQQSQRYSEH